ncbi:MAG: hypothetical protein C4294_04675, partial [Nitrospiraceae bacterium]
DGEIVNQILRAENRHEKEYLVQVDRPFDQDFLDRMARGVVILGRPTRPCLVTRTGQRDFRIILTEGRNRQIRRMCHALGYGVVQLHRIRIMNITIGNCGPGNGKISQSGSSPTCLRPCGESCGEQSRLGLEAGDHRARLGYSCLDKDPGCSKEGGTAAG